MALTTASCTKEIDIDYKDIEPIYVIQGEITDNPARVLLTRSRNVDDPVKATGVNDAEQVMLTDDQGRQEQLVFGNDGYYHSPSGWKGETGHTYTLKVTIKGTQYVASSTMKPAVPLDSIGYVWLATAGMKMLIMQCHHTFPASDELAYTYVTVTKNGNFYRNHTDKQINPNEKHGITLVGCTTEKVMDEDDPEKQDVILHEGDKVHCELWSIDENMYNYFVTLKASQQNASVPVSNFTPRATTVTGYFSAHHASTQDLTFSRSLIK